eukprot:403352811
MTTNTDLNCSQQSHFAPLSETEFYEIFRNHYASNASSLSTRLKKIAQSFKFQLTHQSLNALQPEFNCGFEGCQFKLLYQRSLEKTSQNTCQRQNKLSYSLIREKSNLIHDHAESPLQNDSSSQYLQINKHQLASPQLKNCMPLSSINQSNLTKKLNDSKQKQHETNITEQQQQSLSQKSWCDPSQCNPSSQQSDKIVILQFSQTPQIQPSQNHQQKIQTNSKDFQQNGHSIGHSILKSSDHMKNSQQKMSNIEAYLKELNEEFKVKNQNKMVTFNEHALFQQDNLKSEDDSRKQKVLKKSKDHKTMQNDKQRNQVNSNNKEKDFKGANISKKNAFPGYIK